MEQKVNRLKIISRTKGLKMHKRKTKNTTNFNDESEIETEKENNRKGGDYKYHGQMTKQEKQAKNR